MTPEEFDEEFEASETNGESGEPKKKYLLKLFYKKQVYLKNLLFIIKKS
jgi:hypothetical protein